MSRGDTKNWLASYSPAEQESIKARFGRSETQLRAAALSQTKLYAPTEITGKEVISSNEVRFHIRGPPPISNEDLIVKKIGGQWKVEANFVRGRSEEHTSELQSHSDLVCRLL